MIKIERHNIIMREIRSQGSVLVPALAELLQCSEETVRRDLKELDQAGKLIRTHGGAYIVEKHDKSFPIDLRKSYIASTKSRMAELAMKYIQDNDVLMLDQSTTCLSLAEKLISSGRSYTIITNSLAICEAFNASHSNVELICTGGTLRRRSSSFADPNSLQIIERYHADKAFISCPKVSVQYGLYDNNLSEANVRAKMIQHSGQRFLIVDHTKLEGYANVLFEGLEDINVIITDRELPEEWKLYCKKNHVMM